MDTLVIVIIVAVVVVLVVAALAAFSASRRRRQERRERARQEYGPEYDRAAEEQGSEKKAEEELRERREEVESEVQPLSEESRSRYAERWEEVERTFVNDPEAALEDADSVVADILAERNFPTDSRQEASRGVGVMYSDVVEDFREAQNVHEEATRSRDNGEGEVDLEEMRRAIQRYRSVYERLTKE